MTGDVVEVLVVSHTHWDREWYRPAARFRQRLVALVDDLIDDPPAHGSGFLLDGQSVLLDDYLAVRPDRVAALSALVRTGQLEAGPWYVLPDELIPSGEALVRNLLAGRDAVRRLGGVTPAALYCPDAFGHPAILPELAQGFGCAVVIAWRGYGGVRWPAGDTVRWGGPSGASVVLVHLPPAGYEFGATLPVDAEAARRRWRQMAGVLLPRATTRTVLLLNGADHHARQRGHARAVAALADAAAPVSVRAAALGVAGAALAESADQEPLAEIRGELRDSYGYAWTLGGTLASRAAQKRRNALAERSLVRDVEPWIAALPAGGSPTMRASLDAAWRELLLVHPHDTLCGTAIDDVARAAEGRLASVEHQIDGLRDDALDALLGHDAEAARHAPLEWNAALVIRNPAARARTGVARVRVSVPVAPVAVGPGSAMRREDPAATDAQAFTAKGFQVLSHQRRVSLTESPRAYPRADLVDEFDALCWTDHLPGYAVRAEPLSTRPAFAPPVPVRASGGTLDNGLLRVTVSSHGEVDIGDLSTGRTARHCIAIETHRDEGDLYTPAIREPIDALRYDSCTAGVTGALRAELVLTYRDAATPSMLRLSLQLDAGLGAVRIVCDGRNASPDMRVRLLLRGGAGRGSTTIADAAFHPVARDALVIGDADRVMEHPVPTAPLHRFVTRFGSDRGMTIVSDGLAEYESLADGGIAATLVRAVGELSRSDLPERPGHAGWPAATPAAQCIGPYRAEFALALHGTDTDEQRGHIERLADDVLLPAQGHTLRSWRGAARAADGIILDGDGLAFSAVMPARRPGWIVLRCVNRRASRVAGCWRTGLAVMAACHARLDETPLAELSAERGTIAFIAEPMAIVTILARVGEPLP